MDIISTVKNSITLVNRLREVSKNTSDAEFNDLLAGLSHELANITLESASLKEESVSLKEELASLKDEIRILKSFTPALEVKPTDTLYGQLY
jgi:hypothetical protein